MTPSEKLMSDILSLHINRRDDDWMVTAKVQGHIVCAGSGRRPQIISDVLEEALARLIENNPELSHHG